LSHRNTIAHDFTCKIFGEIFFAKKIGRRRKSEISPQLSTLCHTFLMRKRKTAVYIREDAHLQTNTATNWLLVFFNVRLQSNEFHYLVHDAITRINNSLVEARSPIGEPNMVQNTFWS